MDSTQVGVLEKTNEVRLRCFLKSEDGGGLEAKISLEILSDLADQTLEGGLTDEKLGTLLVLTNLTEGDGSGTVTMGLLHTSGSGCRLTGSLLSSSKIMYNSESLCESRIGEAPCRETACIRIVPTSPERGLPLLRAVIVGTSRESVGKRK